MIKERRIRKTVRLTELSYYLVSKIRYKLENDDDKINEIHNSLLELQDLYPSYTIPLELKVSISSILSYSIQKSDLDYYEGYFNDIRKIEIPNGKYKNSPQKLLLDEKTFDNLNILEKELKMKHGFNYTYQVIEFLLFKYAKEEHLV